MVVAHTHPDDDVFAMFSGPDILKMAEIAYRVQGNSNSTVPFLSITVILVVNGRTFALRFDDMMSVNLLYNIASDKIDRAKFEDKLEKYYNSDKNLSSFLLDTNIYKQQRHLFDFLEDYNLNISMYEANYGADGLVNDWQKINKDTLEKEQCN